MSDPITRAIVAACIGLQLRNSERVVALTLPIVEDTNLSSAILVTRQEIRFSRERVKGLTFDELRDEIWRGSQNLRQGKTKSPT